jgi:hypothetical protein
MKEVWYRAATNALSYNKFEVLCALVSRSEDQDLVVYSFVDVRQCSTKRFSDARALRKESSEQAATNALRCTGYGVR